MMRAALLIALLAVAARAEETGPSFGHPFHFTEVGGGAIYASVCAGCHMPDGRGAVGAGSYPSLANDGRLAAAAYPISRILHGSGAMPPFARTLSDEQVAAVVGFVRTQFGNAYAVPATPADVAGLR